MKTRKWFLLTGTMMLVVLAVLLVISQSSSARASTPQQEPVEETGSDEAVSPQAVNGVANVIVYQGRLTDDAGKPIHDSLVMTLTLYTASTGGTALCQDADNVSVEDGLFTFYMDYCTARDIDGKRVYLGVRAEGDSEMTPRRAIYPVPYAFSLRPGARISDTLPGNAILHVENTGSDGRGLRGYATADSGTNYGVVGASTSPDAFGGYFYNDEGGTGVYGRGSVGGHFVSTSGLGQIGALAEAGGAFGAGLRGDGNVLSYGVWANNDDNIALYVTSDIGGYGALIDANLQVQGDLSVTGSKSGYVVDIAQNSGPETLDVGDVVVVTGYTVPVVGEIPVMLVSKASEAGSTGVVGVVDKAVIFTERELPASIDPSDPILQSPEIQPLLAPQMQYVEAPAAAGEYVSVVTLGVFQTIKVDASFGAIQPGDLLISSPNPGYAMKGTDPKPGTIIGKALGALDSGTGTMPVLITLQ